MEKCYAARCLRTSSAIGKTARCEQCHQSHPMVLGADLFEALVDHVTIEIRRKSPVKSSHEHSQSRCQHLGPFAPATIRRNDSLVSNHLKDMIACTLHKHPTLQLPRSIRISASVNSVGVCPCIRGLLQAHSIYILTIIEAISLPLI